MAVLTEKASNFNIVQALAPAVISATTNGVSIDTQGFNSSFAIIVAGGSLTADGSNYISVSIQDSSDGSTWANVTDRTLTGGRYVNSSGVFVEINGTSKSNNTVDAVGTLDSDETDKIAYTGSKQYYRLVFTETGTFSGGLSAVACNGDGLCPQA